MIWLKSLRPRTTLMATLLCLVGFRVGNVPIGTAEVLVVAFVFIVGGFTMAINDWQDKDADYLGGRKFVAENSIRFRKFVVRLGMLSCLMSLVVLLININYGILSLMLVFFGAMYGSVRKIPYAPGIYMALCGVMPLIYSYFNPLVNVELNYILLGVLFYIYGRETLKDFEDLSQDINTKWTIPNALGEKSAKIIIFASYVIALIAFACLTPVALLVFPFLFSAYLVNQKGGSKRTVKSLTDLPMLALMLWTIML